MIHAFPLVQQTVLEPIGVLSLVVGQSRNSSLARRPKGRSESLCQGCRALQMLLYLLI